MMRGVPSLLSRHLCRLARAPAREATATGPLPAWKGGAAGATRGAFPAGASLLPPRWCAAGAPGRRHAEPGDVVRVHYEGTLEDGSVFDSSRVPEVFTVGRGTVVPGFEKAVIGLAAGDKKAVTIPPEDGFGERSMALVATIPRDKCPEGIAVGQTVSVSTGATAFVTIVEDEGVVIDANHMLAGETLAYEIEMVDVFDGSALEEATLAMGHFWGAELAFQGVKGIAQSCVGYCNANGDGGEDAGEDPPTYEAVESGETGYIQAVQLRFDPGQVSYASILEAFFRHHSPAAVAEEGPHLRSAVFYHSEAQRAEAAAAIAKQAERVGAPLATALIAADVGGGGGFVMAEGEHQRYLEKLGKTREDLDDQSDG